MISLQVLTKKKQIPQRVYQNLLPLASTAPKGNRQFEILLVKIFSLKQNTNQIL